MMTATRQGLTVKSICRASVPHLDLSSQQNPITDERKHSIQVLWHKPKDERLAAITRAVFVLEFMWDRDWERIFLSDILLPLCDFPVRQDIVGVELQVCDKKRTPTSNRAMAAGALCLMAHMLYQILIAFKPLLKEKRASQTNGHFIWVQGKPYSTNIFLLFPCCLLRGQTVDQNKRIRFSCCSLRYFCSVKW